LALDEPKDTDDSFTIDGFTYIVDKDFIEKTKPIKIDFLETGFQVTAGINFGADCSSGCSAKGSCCS
jgi:iron-sulfur cluster assembly protein